MRVLAAVSRPQPPGPEDTVFIRRHKRVRVHYEPTRSAALAARDGLALGGCGRAQRREVRSNAVGIDAEIAAPIPRRRA